MVNSIMPYLGSKKSMLEYILPFIQVDSEVFIESFCGSCATTVALLQTRPNHFKHIIASDTNKNLINLWNYIKTNSETFKAELTNFINSYSMEEIGKANFNSDLESMLQFYVKVCCSSMNNINGVLNYKSYANFRGTYLAKRLENIGKVSEIIQPVEFINCSYKDSINKAVSYGLKTCCFADPPYKVDFLRGQQQCYENDLIDLSDIYDSLTQCDNFIISHSEDEVFELLFKNFRGTTLEINSNFGWSRKEIYKYK